MPGSTRHKADPKHAISRRHRLDLDTSFHPFVSGQTPLIENWKAVYSRRDAHHRRTLPKYGFAPFRRAYQPARPSEAK
ncbi:hypothetical protein LNQ03_03420 [Klebsiella pneumoniae subsp. pneumoniae]|nr:hypothetical protein [Klebsiella pneumoniae subsp. pneumoniae]